uniref:protein indeterminate-domain 7-like n=1 Tax=Erigeron canadensis TaxID=72917 RepID=UPI001CB8DF9F|nr:protein indeterminate-domain 7-like [Erigeron canadensis]
MESRDMKSIFLDDNMSNLTSASNEAISLSSSSNRNEIGTMYPPPHQMHQSSFGSVPLNTNNNTNSQTQSNKKKRNLPGNPDPEAEVIALSPKSLMATNRFLCEICNKGFQRDQNLQLHRRGHNLPWKLKQKSKTEVVRRKVYVCPEPSCVHHEPSRALGDLTGIKKHFSRKHGEKKWKCEKCSKRYAVQSDWKAHSKICGTREYRCDCGTLFSRRDSFITHRAFCDALAEETAGRSSSSSLNHILPLQIPINYPLKTEPQHLLQHPQLSFNIGSSSPPQHHHQIPSWLNHQQQQQQNPNPNNNLHLLPSPNNNNSSHMSATALLQKAAQMGVTMSNNNNNNNNSNQQSSMILNNHGSQVQGLIQHQQQQDHMCAPSLSSLHHHHSANLSTSDHHNNNHHHVMLDTTTTTTSSSTNCMDHLLLNHHHQPNSLTSTSVGSSATNSNNINQIFNGMLSSSLSTTKKLDHHMNNGYQQPQLFPQPSNDTTTVLSNARKDGGQGVAGANDELTRDFLGLRGFPNPNDHHHFINMAAASLDHMSQINPNHNQNQIPWQG